MMRKIYVLYHAHCTDGFGAAFAAWLKFKETAVYLPVNYGEPLPDIEDGSDVYILDFSYPRAVLVELAKRLNLLLVLDHHKSAEKELEGLEFAVFGQTVSGAVLTWIHFFPLDKQVPQLLRYVQDRDLWKWELPESREVSAALRIHPMEFEHWDYLINRIHGVDLLKEEGKIVLQVNESVVRSQVKGARWVRIGAYTVPVVNATTLISETCEKLLEFYLTPFVGVYFDRPDGKRQWSLRSRPDFDCSEVAKLFGGGGHKQAAGFVQDLAFVAPALPLIPLQLAQTAEQAPETGIGMLNEGEKTPGETQAETA